MNHRKQATTPQPDATRTALDLLAAGVPLSLLLDLATAVNSHDVYAHEPGVADWLDARVA